MVPIGSLRYRMLYFSHSSAHNLLPPATKLGQGNIFCSGGGEVGSPGPLLGGCWGVWLGGSAGPHPGEMLGGLAGGGLRPTHGGCWGVWPGGSRPTPEEGVSRPRLGEWGACIPACTEADTPPPQQMATAASGTHPTGMQSCSIYILWVPNARKIHTQSMRLLKIIA